jgi:hypothetical protein
LTADLEGQPLVAEMAFAEGTDRVAYATFRIVLFNDVLHDRAGFAEGDSRVWVLNSYTKTLGDSVRREWKIYLELDHP